MKKRILLVGDYSDNDISALNSTDGPLSYFNDLFEVSYPPEKDGWWNNFRNWLYVDCALVHRPWSDRHRKTMDAAKLHGVKLWVHHDDDLTCIPKSNQNFPITAAQSPGSFGCVEYSYQIADILSVQSTLMYNETKHRNDPTFLIPVCIDDRLLKFQRGYSPNKIVAWRGSPTHVSDLLHFHKPLQKIFDYYSDWEFHFFGVDPLALGFKIHKPFIYPETTMWQFYKNFTDLNPSKLLVCLEDNKFNRVKSHLAWLDGTLAGAQVIAPDFHEFDHPGVFKYSCPEAMFNAFEESVLESDGHSNYVSWELIERDYLVSRTRGYYADIWELI